MKRRLTVFTALMLVFMLVFSTVGVSAKTLSEINKELEQKRQELKEGKEEEARLDDEIESLEVKINKTENELVEIDEEIEEIEEKIDKTEKELKEAEEKVDEQNESLNKRLRAMYKHGSIGFIDVLLGSGSISEFISNMDMVKKIFASDKAVLEDLQKNYDLIEEKKNELDSLKADLENKKQEQIDKKAELEADKQELAKKKSNVVANNENLEDNIQDLEAEQGRIQSIINNDSSSNGGGSGGEKYNDGQFAWPVPGYSRISSDYGYRICPFHGREIHSGIDIPAAYGTSVVAAASGTVVFSGYLGSYGNAVIISHGGNLYTLYGHNSSLVVSSGTKVSKGQTVSRIGSTGSSTGNHLHFEVRKGGNSYGNHVSPWNYL